MVQTPESTVADTLPVDSQRVQDALDRWVDLPPELEFLQAPLLGPTILQWLLALVIVALAYPTLRILLRFVVGRIKVVASRTQTDLDDMVVGLLMATKGIVVFLVAVAMGATALGDPYQGWTANAARLAVLIQAGFWLVGLMVWALERYRDREMEKDDAGVATAVGALAFLGRVAVWALVLLTGLSMLGFHIGPALAGLGVGGIAIALAVQNILGDLFASLSIIFDRPFVVGDFIVVGDEAGTVEHVGLKTTRVRSISGEQLVFSNSDLLSSRVRNYKRMDERRILFRFGVEYDIGIDRLRAIPGVVRDLFDGIENVRFDRAHFASFGDSSLDFEVVYYLTSADYTAYMDAQQEINFELYRRLEELEVGFAFPTRTVHLIASSPAPVVGGEPLTADAPADATSS
jgi:small-conductance mechanosensitive channel